MKYYLGFSIGLLYLLILSACTFNNPEEKYFEEVKQNLPEATISLADFIGKDTIYLFQASNVSYSITAPKLSVREVSVLVGQTQIFSSPAMTGSFSINGALVKTGYFELKILIKSNSGSGSLADKNVLESAEIWKKWVLAIDVDPPPTPIMQTSKENGFLKISWTPLTKKNFKNYVVTKNNQEYIINNRSQAFFIDSSYVSGSSLRYQLIVNTYLHSSFNAIAVSYPQSVTIEPSSMDSTVILKWSKSKFERAFKNATIIENNTVRKVITDVNDTSLVLKLKEALFGGESNITITINAKYPGNYPTPFSETKKIDYPTGAKKIHEGQSLYYSKAINSILGYNATLLRIYDSSMKETDSFSISGLLSMPYPGNYIYYTISGGVAQLNLQTREVKTYLTKGTHGTPITPSLISGTNGNLVSYIFLDRTYPSDVRINSGIIDFTNNVNALSQYDERYSPLSFLFSSLILSDDGRYSKTGQIIRNFDGNALTTLLPNNDYFFRQDNNDEIIYQGTPTTVINTKNGDVLRTISPPISDYYLANYDPATKKLFYKSSNATKIYLIDIENQKATPIDAWSNGCGYFLNGILFDYYGNYKKIIQ